MGLKAVPGGWVMVDDPEYLRNRTWWWTTLRTLRSEWYRLDRDFDDFDTWVRDTWGVRVVYSEGGLIAGHYEIADEKKHLVFLLKYL